MLKGAIYARYSSHGQNEQSIEGQVNDCLRYAEENNIKIIQTYTDRAKTGTNDQRDGLQAMLSDAKKGIYDVILVWKIDRFGRNREEMALNKVKLKKGGAKLVSVKENIPDGPEGALIESLMEGLAEYYSLNLAQNIRRGVYQNAEKCKSNGALPYGYYADENQDIHIDESTAPIVREIYKRFLSGETYSEIEETLRDRGIKTSHGNPYRSGTVKRILENPRYAGTYVYGKVVIPDGMPAIISKEDFEKTKKRIKAVSYQSKAQNRKEVSMLAGKIYCGKCKNVYVCDNGTGRHGKIYRYYSCSGKKLRRAKPRCKAKTLSAPKLDDFVLHVTLFKVLTCKNIDFIADRVMAELERQKKSPYLQAIKADKEDTEKRLKNLMEAVENGLTTKTTLSRLKALENQLEDINISIKLETSKKDSITKDAVIWFLNRFKKMDYTSEKSRSLIFKTLVNAVHINGDKVTIAYNFTESDGTIAQFDTDTSGSSLGTFGGAYNADREPILYFSERYFFVHIKLEI